MKSDGGGEEVGASMRAPAPVMSRPGCIISRNLRLFSSTAVCNEYSKNEEVCRREELHAHSPRKARAMLALRVAARLTCAGCTGGNTGQR